MLKAVSDVVMVSGNEKLRRLQAVVAGLRHLRKETPTAQLRVDGHAQADTRAKEAVCTEYALGHEGTGAWLLVCREYMCVCTWRVRTGGTKREMPYLLEHIKDCHVKKRPFLYHSREKGQ